MDSRIEQRFGMLATERIGPAVVSFPSVMS